MSRTGNPDSTYPCWEVSLRLKVLFTVLIPFEVPEISLQREGGQQEVGLLSEHALRVQDLFPQVPVVIIPRNSVTRTQENSCHVLGEWHKHVNRTQISLYICWQTSLASVSVPTTPTAEGPSWDQITTHHLRRLQESEGPDAKTLSKAHSL